MRYLLFSDVVYYSYTLLFDKLSDYNLMQNSMRYDCQTLLMIASTIYKGFSFKILSANGLL